MIEAENDQRDDSSEATVKTGKSKPRGFSYEEIVAISVGFLVSGNETTAYVMSSAAYLLALNPDIQEKLQSEIDHFFEHNPVNSIPYSQKFAGQNFTKPSYFCIAEIIIFSAE